MTKRNLRPPWWRGSRGEWYVVVQLLLITLLLFGPANWEGAPHWPEMVLLVGRYAGTLLIVTGTALAVMATFHLGESLTPLPHPRDAGRLVTGGAYRLVRHPIYGGILLAALGWALWREGWLTLGYSVLLFLFFDIKSRREEAWLCLRYPDYPAYRRRVSKLIPFVY